MSISPGLLRRTVLRLTFVTELRFTVVRLTVGVPTVAGASRLPRRTPSTLVRRRSRTVMLFRPNLRSNRFPPTNIKCMALLVPTRRVPGLKSTLFTITLIACAVPVVGVGLLKVQDRVGVVSSGESNVSK